MDLYVYINLCRSIFIYLNLCTHKNYLSVFRLLVCQSVYSFVCSSVHPSTRLPVGRSVCLSLRFWNFPVFISIIRCPESFLGSALKYQLGLKSLELNTDSFLSTFPNGAIFLISWSNDSLNRLYFKAKDGICHRVADLYFILYFYQSHWLIYYLSCASASSCPFRGPAFFHWMKSENFYTGLKWNHSPLLLLFLPRFPIVFRNLLLLKTFFWSCFPFHLCWTINSLW